MGGKSKINKKKDNNNSGLLDGVDQGEQIVDSND